jgi:hypothetical protein
LLGLLFYPTFLLQITGKHKLQSLAVTTYDFRTAMKRVGPSVRR